LTKTFPGAAASRAFVVIAATTIVRMRLWLNGSACTIKTGRENPGADPAGAASEAHQISPRRI
jgi:hypothetical protein